MTRKPPLPAGCKALLASMGRVLVVAWMVVVLAAYFQLLFARVLSMAGATP